LWLLIASLVLLVCAIAVAVIIGLGASFRSSQPYRLAWEQVRSDSRVVERLGQPISDTTWIPAGSIVLTDPRGEASFIFHIAGPKGKAYVSVQARKFGGPWELQRVEVHFEDGQRITVEPGTKLMEVAPGSSPDTISRPDVGGDAPKWKPGPAAPHPDPQDRAPDQR